MRHLIICREYPPAPGGGIGTYVDHISRLLATHGETVHVIGQAWAGAEKMIEEKYGGRLIVHRIPFEAPNSVFKPRPHQRLTSVEGRGLFASGFHPLSFAWQAGLLAESLIESEGIDVVEAQEYEAPLYFVQLRRALGLGPRRVPPCIVHLHSPTEQIARHNDWNPASLPVLTATRLEAYTIAAADALLCPSHYLARQIETDYGLPGGQIHIIPLPLAGSPMIERDERTWGCGTICYTGRLEPRKGILEWLSATVSVAGRYPGVRFAFVGANCLSSDDLGGEELLRRLIPRRLASRFLFYGQQAHAALPGFLSQARIAVVPSRWENFPYSCVEAMSSGLPVIATRQGGMLEMIDDGQTGWLADTAAPPDLGRALERALATAPAELKEMGCRASADIRRHCENERILEQHLEMRRRLVGQGASPSLHLPPVLPQSRRPQSAEPVSRRSGAGAHAGLAIVIVSTSSDLSRCVHGLERQTCRPSEIVLVTDGSAHPGSITVLDRVRRNGWQVILADRALAGAQKNAGIDAVLGSGLRPLGFAFVHAGIELRPEFVAECEAALKHCPEVGLVSCWTDNPGKGQQLQASLCPSFPYQWLANEAVSYSAVRTEALRDAKGFDTELDQGYEDWDLANAVMAAGWIAVTLPAVLGKFVTEQETVDRLWPTQARIPSRRLLERFPDLIAHGAPDIAMLAGSSIGRAIRHEPPVLQEQMEVVYTLLADRRRLAQAVSWALSRLKMRIPKGPRP